MEAVRPLFHCSPLVRTQNIRFVLLNDHVRAASYSLVDYTGKSWKVQNVIFSKFLSFIHNPVPVFLFDDIIIIQHNRLYSAFRGAQ